MMASWKCRKNLDTSSAYEWAS